jgi:hypothetical protein
MDPFIEACDLWGDFHTHLIEKIYEALADAVPERYVVRTGERSYLVLIGAEGKDKHPFLPDVGVTAIKSREEAPAASAAVATEPRTDVRPIPMRPFIEEEYRETFVEIYETDPETRLVTSIEILSPSNKRPKTPGWEPYQRKRQTHLLGEANLVEIDLLRAGERPPMLDPWPDSPYTLLVARPGGVPRCLVWPVSYREPLPPIPVPLARPDPDVPLHLQVLIEGIYARSRYGRSIDYAAPLNPPLQREEAAWMRNLLGGNETPSKPARARPARKRRRR